MRDTNRVIYERGGFRRPDVQKLFELIAFHQIPQLPKGHIFWLESVDEEGCLGYERVRIEQVIVLKNELTVCYTKLESGAFCRDQLRSMHPTDLFRLKSTAMLAELVAKEPTLVGKQLEAAA